MTCSRIAASQVATAEAANALPLLFAAAVCTVRRNQLDPVRASVKLLATLLNPGDKALASAGWAHLRPVLQVGVVLCHYLPCWCIAWPTHLTLPTCCHLPSPLATGQQGYHTAQVSDPS